ncbi:MAG: TolC family protein [Bryobacterales bacterium]|nr:TolC family protein [Bryobacterales bacterium]
MPLCLAAAFCLAGLPPGRAQGPSSELGPIPLSLREAVDFALAPDGDARVALATELVEQTRQRRLQTRAALLPQLDSSISQQNIVRNLAAFGIRVQLPGFSIPSIVGPFNVFDARVTATQTIFDLAALKRDQAARIQTKAAESGGADTRQQTTAAVARAYVSAQLAQQRYETAQSDVDLAGELVESAENRLKAGAGVRIEATRARVQLADRKRQLLEARTQSRAAELQLARMLGLSFERPIELTTPLEEPLPPEPEPGDALENTLEHRADWQTQMLRQEAADRSDSAVRWERLPSLTAFGDYGTIGSSVTNAQPTRTVGASLRIPVFDGGRREARRSETASLARQESIRTRDLRRQIEMEVRLTADSLATAAEQVEVAKAGLELAEEEQDRAKRRYEAGVGTSLEATDAQTRLARARQSVVDALGLYNLARIDWSEARGRIESVIP